jgi:hypothetical protein
MVARRRVFAALCLALLFALPSSVSAEIGPAKWKGRAPITVTLVSELSSAYQSLAVLAAADWSASPVVDYVFGPDANRIKRVRIVEVNNPASQWLGLTSISNERGYITAATVYLNRYYLDTQTENERRQTVCHELGHGLGLAHTTAPDSCLGTGGSYLPGARDFSDLELMYGK